MSEVQLLNTKALMVFCEGPHDVAFCRLVFRKLFRAEKFEHIFAEFPAPLNNLFRASLERHLLQDMSVDMAHKFYLPDSVLKLVADNCEWLILLFNCGGKDRIDNPRGFLEDYLELFAQPEHFRRMPHELLLIPVICFSTMWMTNSLSKSLKNLAGILQASVISYGFLAQYR